MKQVIRRHVAVLLVIFLVSTVWAQQAKYVFYFIGDGMGVNQVNGTEMYLAEQEGRIGVKPLLFTTPKEYIFEIERIFGIKIEQ